MSLVSSVTTVTIIPRSAPSWWLDDTFHPVGTWQSYAGGSGAANTVQRGNRISDASPTTTAGIFAYSGMATEQETKSCFFMGGGHNDYAGNEVLKLSLNTSVPGWSLFAAKTQASINGDPCADSGNNNRGQTLADINLGNNRPCSFHSSHNLLCHNGKMWIPQMWGVRPGGGDTLQSSARFSVDTTTGTWTAYGRLIPTYPWSAPGQSIPTVVLASRNEIWGGYDHTTQGDIITYRMSTVDGSVLGTYTRGGTVTVNGNVYSLPAGQSRYCAAGAACEIYPSGARPSLIWSVLYSNGQRPTGYYVIDPTAPNVMYKVTLDNQSGIAYNAAGTFSECSRAGYHHLWGTNKIYALSAMWDGNRLDRFLKITIPTGDTASAISSQQWTTTLVSPGGTTPPANATDQIYGRFTLIQDMGDGRPAIVAVPNGLNSSIYVLKMPAGGL